MKATINKTKIFIVGGFPNSNKKMYGGQVTACGALLESSFSDLYSNIGPTSSFPDKTLISYQKTYCFQYSDDLLQTRCVHNIFGGRYECP